MFHKHKTFKILSSSKTLIALVAGSILAGTLYAQLDIPTNISNAVQTIRTIYLTSDGTSAGNSIIRFNAPGAATMTVSGTAIVGDTSTNSVNGLRSSVLAGERNVVTGNNSVVAGGYSNRINGNNSVIPGGSNNVVNANISFAAGNAAVVNTNHHGTFIWSDNQGTPYQSTNTNQFLIRAQNGVGINTNTPTVALTVAGTGSFGSGVRALVYCEANGTNCRTIAELYQDRYVIGADYDIVSTGGSINLAVSNRGGYPDIISVVIPNASTSMTGIVLLTSLTGSTSTTLGATANAVNIVNDYADIIYTYAKTKVGTGGTVTPNYLSKFLTAGTVSNSQLYDNGTNIGIGTASPIVKLHVVGEGLFSVGVRAQIYCDENGQNCKDIANVLTGELDPQVGNLTNNYVPKWNGSTLVDGTIYDNGDLGLGTTTTTEKLTVNGSIDINADNNGYILDDAGTTTKRFGLVKYLGMGAALVSANTSDVVIGHVTNSDTDVTAGTSATVRKDLVINSAGNVGMGVSNPAYKLDVNGSAGVSATLNTLDLTVTGLDPSTEANALVASAGGVVGKRTIGGNWGNIANIGSDGVMEVGKYIDFHNSNNHPGTDYDLRLNATPGALNVGGTVTATAFLGNATTATSLSTDRTNWSTNGTISDVVGQLAWKNYGNNHTIFDASAGTSPNGTAINNTNAQVAWSATYPTLMGWNGANTYGVRVDSARLADTASNADTVDGYHASNFVDLTSAQTVAGAKTFSSVLRATPNGAAYFCGGDDSCLYDVNVANTVGIYGNQDATKGGLRLGSAGADIYGAAGNIGIGTVSPGYKLHVMGSIYADGGWLRTSGNAGWYNESFGGGLYMTDTTWIRTYGDKNFYHNAGIMRTDGELQVGPSGDRFRVDGAGNAQASGVGKFGASAIIGSSIPAGYYQDPSNGAYRAFNVANAGYYFQSYNGATTSMFVGLVGTYANRVGIGTITPAANLDVVGTAKLQYGATVNEFSTDGTFAGNSDSVLPTEKAVKTYVDNAATKRCSLQLAFDRRSASRSAAKKGKRQNGFYSNLFQSLTAPLVKNIVPWDGGDDNHLINTCYQKNVKVCFAEGYNNVYGIAADYDATMYMRIDGNENSAPTFLAFWSMSDAQWNDTDDVASSDAPNYPSKLTFDIGCLYVD